MGLRFGVAQAVGALATLGLKHVFHRPAANFPGKIGLYIDPRLIAHCAQKLRTGSLVVVGTNGKTTTTNLLADALERAGITVACNRTGANLDSGVATTLLHTPSVSWGVFESDELWLVRILPQLQANYVLLLNLFRDQLDRCGEIDHIQDSIVAALAASPRTALIYNGDDPLCTAIALRAAQMPERADCVSLAFGIDEDLGLSPNTVADATMCQQCSSMLDYSYRQYGQLGVYMCPNCGFRRPQLDYVVKSVRCKTQEVMFSLYERTTGDKFHITAPLEGAYMVYNLAAVIAAARLLGCPIEAVQKAFTSFDPKNGRLERFVVNGRPVLLNLAKNPTGFNQNLKIVTQGIGSRSIAFFINDKEADGHDVSWLWDIDFEELACCKGLTAFAGGIRAYDMQVRLKYAGITTYVVKDISDMMARIAMHASNEPAYVIANYTALPGVKADLERLAAHGTSTCVVASAHRDAINEHSQGDTAVEDTHFSAVHLATNVISRNKSTHEDASGGLVPNGALCEESVQSDSMHNVHQRNTNQYGLLSRDNCQPLVIAHLFPDLLNLYGDGGNVRVLFERARRRGIPCAVLCVYQGSSFDVSQVDLVFLGGGPDKEQRCASQELFSMRGDLRNFVEDDGVLLAICGGYQILGSTWLLGDEVIEGLGILDIETKRPGSSANRLIDNIVLQSNLATHYVVGYENHAGRTFLGKELMPFGRVISTTGQGNNDADKADGVLYRNVIGTYLHGPLLAKNPEIADWLLARALEHRARRIGQVDSLSVILAPLDDSAEYAANAAVCARFVR